MAQHSSFDFEHRLFLTEDAGTAFQQFVWEALSHDEFTGRQLVQHPLRGRDGAIDLVEMSNGTRTALECKFHGDSRTDPAARDWRDVLKTLKKNLPALCQLPADDQRRSPYHPWISKDGPITEYVFCTSATLPNENAFNALSHEIDKGLKEIALLHPELSHLAYIKARVLAGQHFLGILTKLPTLRYRWFGGLPNGMSALESYSSRGKIFRRFLSSETLPYFSYADFTRDTGRSGSRVQADPSSTLAALLSGDHASLVISGPGGVGKTRLGLEIAQAAARQGLLTAVCGPTTDEDAVRMLARASGTPQQALLFVDYAESHPHLVGIVAAVDAANLAGHHFRIVATCRSSSLSTVIRSLDEFGVTRLELIADNGSAGDGAYLGWVASQILQYGGLSDIPGLCSICDKLPVLAAFAIHLRRSGHESFDRLFGDLAADTSFEGWAKRRIDALVMSVGLNTNAMHRMAEVAAILPLTAADAHTISHSSVVVGKIIEGLLSDGWIDDEGGNLIPSHDVFVDAILSAYIFEPGAIPTIRARDIALNSLPYSGLSRFLENTDRLAGHPRFDLLDGRAVVDAISLKDPSALAKSARHVLKTRILDHQAIVDVITCNLELSDLVTNDGSLYGQLSYITKVITQDIRISPIDTGNITRLLQSALSKGNDTANLLLRRAFELNPSTFSSLLLSRLAADGSTHESHYLLVAWLKAGYEKSTIRSYVLDWLLVHCPRSLKSSFLISNWLIAGGDVELAQPFVSSWLSLHGIRADAAFVIAAWLRSKNDIEIIEPHIQLWLEKHGTSKYAGLIYANWPSESGKLGLIEKYFIAWSRSDSSRESSFYSYKYYLSSGGDFSAVEDGLFRWILTNPDSRSSGFAYDLWITNGGETEKIYEPLAKWLDVNGSTLAASFIYNRWLGAGGESEQISKYIWSWLDHHSTTEAAGHVLRAWIRSQNDTVVVEPFLLRWLEGNLDSEQFDFVISEWLEAGGSFLSVQEIVRNWLVRNLERESLIFILKPLSRRGDLDYRTVAVLAAWCQIHCAHTECITRIGPIYGKYGKGPMRIALAEVLISVLERLEPSDLRITPNKVASIASVARLLESTRSYSKAAKIMKQRIRSVHVFMMQSCRLYDNLEEVSHIYFMRSTSLIANVTEMISLGDLTLSEDAETIESFRRWVSSWPANSFVDPSTSLGELNRALRSQSLKEAWTRDLSART